MLHFLFILFLNPFGIFDTEKDNIVTVEKKIKIHHFKHVKVICYKIDSCTFYFDAHQFMTEVGVNAEKHKYHEPVLKELNILLTQKDTVDISSHKQASVVSSLVNDGLEKGFVTILFSGKHYLGKTIINIEYWDKDILASEYKNNSFYRPDGDVFTLVDGEIFYYFKPALARSEHRFRD
jgi:hypothetical protein